MSRVGWVGLGKLGLPCALVLQHVAGHDVVGYDVNRDRVLERLKDPTDRGEKGLGELIAKGLTVADSVDEVVRHADVVFVAVQTPHDPRYGGEQPMPGDPVDFEYGFLIQAVREVCNAAGKLYKPITLVVVSTVLPGTTRAHLAPLCGQFVNLVYSPAFIAMGTVIQDWTHPEFVLIGRDQSDDELGNAVADVFDSMHGRPQHHVSIESAELLKVAYNCFISMKVVFGNMLMEICQKTGADCDEVVDGLALATDRIVSPAYLRGGMGDGGGCHPRDNQAMSWLAKRLDLSVDLMGFVSRAREDQSQWLASVAGHWSRMTTLPVVLLGAAYKPGTALTAGSPALLLRAQLGDAAVHDPHVELTADLTKPAVFVVTTRHPEFPGYTFAPGSIVIDPWGYMPDQPGVTVIRLGRKG